MSAVASRTEAYNTRPKGIMGGGSLSRFSKVRSAFCVKFLRGIIYAITKLSHEQIDLYNSQRASPNAPQKTRRIKQISL